MKTIKVIAIFLVYFGCYLASFGDISSTNENVKGVGGLLLELSQLNRVASEKGWTTNSFEIAREVAEELVKIDPKKGLRALSSLYLGASADLFGRLEAYEKALQTLDRYKQMGGAEGDLSDYRAPLVSMIEKLKKIDASAYERVPVRPAQMKENNEQPSEVLRSRELFLQYATEENVAYLDEALEIMTAACRRDATNYKLYAALVPIYMAKGDYANAYAAWQLAINFGPEESASVEGVTANLYLDALSYEISYGVTENPPGSDFSRYFLWLNREIIWSHISPATQSEIRNIIIKMRSKREGSESKRCQSYPLTFLTGENFPMFGKQPLMRLFL
jgi:tetratricopeptide (TPR) repeat protein